MKTCWNFLSDKAKAVARDAQAAVVEARLKAEKLMATEAHIEKMRIDYVDRFNAAQKEAHQISDNIAYRQFLDHLQELKGRVHGQVLHAELQVANAKAALTVAQREQAKMEAMVERDMRQRAELLAKSEQRAMDEAGIRLFNQR